MRLSLWLLLAMVAAAPAAMAQTITFADWIAAYELAGDDAEPAADPDGDGLPNLLEYAIEGLDPTSNDVASDALPSYIYLRRTGDGLGEWEEVTAPDRASGLEGVYHVGIRWTPRAGVTGIRFRPELSHELQRWYSGRSAFLIESVPAAGVRAVAIAQNNPFVRFFARLRVEIAPDIESPLGGIAVAGVAAQALDVSSPVALPRVTADGSEEELQIADRLVLRTTGAATITDYRWEWRARPTNLEPVELTRSSSAPSVIEPDPEDPYLWRAVSTGTATLTLRTGSSTYTASVTVSTATGQTVDVTTGFAPDSLRAHLVAQIDPLLEGKSKATALRVYTTQNHGAATYVRNSSLWAAPYAQALTAISPWNSTGGATRAGVLVTPRHILFATHYQIATGATVRFVASDGTVVDRTMTAKAPLPGYTPYYPDITVGLLDSDVPETITPAKIMPDDWAEKLPGASTALRVPTLGLDQEEKALVSDLLSITAASGKGGAMVWHLRPATARAEFYEDKVGGDSGNPSFLIVNGELVVTTVWTHGGGGGGTSVHYHADAIDTLLTTLGGDYTLTRADWSEFASYSE